MPLLTHFTMMVYVTSRQTHHSTLNSKRFYEKLDFLFSYFERILTGPNLNTWNVLNNLKSLQNWDLWVEFI